jgi:hypothetical protein
VTKVDQIREAAEQDLKVFARLVNPKRVYGGIHDEVMDWWQGSNCADNTLLLLPRAHMKSHLAAVYAAWLIIKHPYITMLYISATSDLAEKQLYAIKNILDSKAVRRYWPQLIHPDEGKREKWSATEISVDHPVRKEEGVRDPTVKAAGLTTNITGFHTDWNFLDDVVVPNNAYTEDGRSKVAAMYSQLSSIKNTDAKTTVVGTRYHPKDLYDTLLNTKVELWAAGEMVSKEPLYDVLQRVVEEEGEFLWPKTTRSDGRSFGFDMNELAKKKAEYIDITQFYAQYYNNPNDPGSAKINPTLFQYYDKKYIEQREGRWYYKDNRLNVFAAIDFAYSLNKKADFSAIVVVGVDQFNNFYVLAIDRFKTGDIKVYYDHIVEQHTFWGFRKMRAEVTAAQEVIVNDLKNNYIKPNGLSLVIEPHRPTKHDGAKEERMMSTLQPKYSNGQMWHYRGGNCQLLEEELKMGKPPHDDISDALSNAVDVAVAPSRRYTSSYTKKANVYHGRFGGVAVA